MKRYLLIELTTGEKHEIDISLLVQAAIKQGIDLISAGENHPQYILWCRDFAINGFTPDPKARPPRWIAPSQIKHVDVVFDTTMFPNHKIGMP